MFTAREIEKATGGYVNSGVLRQWIMKGYIKAGPRVKLPGGPRSFSMREVIKAMLIAELRRSGFSLEGAGNAAEQIARHDDQRGSSVYWVLVDPRRSRVTPITLSDGDLPFGELIPSADSVLVLNYMNIRQRALRAHVWLADLSGGD